MPPNNQPHVAQDKTSSRRLISGSEMNRRQSVNLFSAGLGRVSEESAEFFERVSAVLQKQENMLRAAQAEVTPTRPLHLSICCSSSDALALPAGLNRLRLASPAAPWFPRGRLAELVAHRVHDSLAVKPADHCPL